MNTSRYLYFLLLAWVCGCQPAHEKNPPEENQPPTTATLPPSSKESKEFQKMPLLHVVQRTHQFSSKGEPDYFRLTLRGDSVTAGQVEFVITTRTGQQIYQELFSAADLEANMVYTLIQNTPPTAAERETYILNRMNEFVQDANFLTPAISQGATPDTSLVKLSTWRELQANKGTIGFKYLLGKEDGRLLVYDPKQQKAIRYGSFGG